MVASQLASWCVGELARRSRATKARRHENTKTRKRNSWVSDCRGFVLSWLACAPVAAEKRGRCRDERRCMRSEDRAVAAVGHDPQKRSRDRGVQLEGDRDRIEEIAIAKDDQRVGRNRRQQRRREVQLVEVLRALVALR